MPRTPKKRLSDRPKLSCRSLRSIVRRTKAAVGELVDEGVTFLDGDVTLEAYVNAAVCSLNALTVVQRVAAVRRQIPAIEAAVETEGVVEGRKRKKAAQGPPTVGSGFSAAGPAADAAGRAAMAEADSKLAESVRVNNRQSEEAASKARRKRGNGA